MVFDFFTYLIIPAATMLFARNTNWFTTNFSVIGSGKELQLEFWLWGSLVGGYFYYAMKKVIRRLPHSEKAAFLASAAMVLLALAFLTPYLPKQFPFSSFLHVIFAFCSAASLFSCLLFTLFSLYLRSPKTYLPFLIGLCLIVIVCAVLFWRTGIINSAMEIFFVISCSILVNRLHKTV